MISIINLKVSYRNTKVLKSLNLALEEPLIHGIVGLNGAGKTTLLNAIYGLKKITSGNIQRNHQKITKKRISFLPTENYFYSGITGKDYLRLFRNPNYQDDIWNELFLLPLDQTIDEYSTGMKKKLALMGVLKQDKPLMLLDEPFDRLDIETGRILHSLLIRLKEKGKTILVTSHILETLTDLCDKIHYLAEGTIQYSKDRGEFESFKQEIKQFIEKKHEKKMDKLIQ